MPIEISALNIPQNSKRAGESAHETLNVTKKIDSDAKTAVNIEDTKTVTSESFYLKRMPGIKGDGSARYLSEALCATMARETDPEAKVIIPLHELVVENINTESEELTVSELNTAAKTSNAIYGKQKIVGLLTPTIPGIQDLENGISCNKSTLKQLLTMGGFGKIAARRFFFKDCDPTGNIFFIKDPTKKAVTVLQLVELDYGMAFFDSLHAQKLLADKEAEKMPEDPTVFDVTTETFAEKLLGEMTDLPFLAHHVFSRFIKDISELKKETPALADNYFSEQYQAYAELVKKGLDPKYAAKLKSQFNYDALTLPAQQAFDAQLKEIAARVEMFKPIVALGKKLFVETMHIVLDKKYAVILQKETDRLGRPVVNDRTISPLAKIAAVKEASDTPKKVAQIHLEATDVKLDRLNATNGSAFFKPLPGGSSDLKAGSAHAALTQNKPREEKPIVFSTERPKFFSSRTKPIPVPGAGSAALKLKREISGSQMSTSGNSGAGPMSMSVSPALVGSPSTTSGGSETPVNGDVMTSRSSSVISPTTAGSPSSLKY